MALRSSGRFQRESWVLKAAMCCTLQPSKEFSYMSMRHHITLQCPVSVQACYRVFCCSLACEHLDTTSIKPNRKGVVSAKTLLPLYTELGAETATGEMWHLS